jgi:AraC family transcriptional regulator
MTLRRRAGEFWGTGLPQREAGGFRIQTLEATAREEDVHLHSHDDAHFVLVLAGAYISSAAGAPELSATPLLVFNPAGTTHRDRFLHGRGAFMAMSVPDGAGDARGGDAVAVRDPAALRAARRLCAAASGGAPSAMALEGGAWQLLGALSDEDRSAAPPPWLRTAFEMIWTSDDPRLTPRDVAAYVGVHPVHLARVFRDHLDCSPGDCLRGRRLERAVSVIGRGTASLAAAAADAGYVDQSHLTRAFQAAFAMTPAAWRRGRARDVSGIQDRAPRAG